MSELRDLVAYNRWANGHLFALVERASSEGLEARQPGMYGSVIETLTHLVNVERNFLRRIRDESRDRLSNVSVAELRAEMDALGPAYLRMLDAEADLERPVFIPWLDDGVNLRLADAVVQPLVHSIQHRADIIGALSREGL